MGASPPFIALSIPFKIDTSCLVLTQKDPTEQVRSFVSINSAQVMLLHIFSLYT